MRLLACLIVAPQRGYDEPATLSYAISSFCPTSADGLHLPCGTAQQCCPRHAGLPARCGSSLQRNDADVWLCEYPGLSFQRSPVCACSLVSSLLLSGATMSQQSSLTQSAHSVRQVLTAYTPGNSPGTMTVAGNLAFQSGALYLIQVNPSTASSANVTTGGSATLAGTVNAAFASGSYVTRNYTILSAAGGLSGTTFNTLTTSNLPAGFTASLSYTATDAILNLIATLGQPSAPSGSSAPSGPSALACAFSINQCNVANSLNAFFNSGGALPPNFVTIFGLTGGNLANALTLLSGEAATGSQQVAFQLGNQFLGLI